jgi:hypothetical protein
VEAFNELQMGPLVRNPVVVANFKPPAAVVEVPQVRLEQRVSLMVAAAEPFSLC